MFRLKQSIHFEHVFLHNLPSVIAEHVRRFDELTHLTSVTWLDQSHHTLSSIDIQVPFAILIAPRLKAIRFRCRSATCTRLAQVLICGFNPSIVEEIILSGSGSAWWLSHRIRTSENIKFPCLKRLELEPNPNEEKHLSELLGQLSACECKSLRSVTVTVSKTKSETATKDTLRLLGQLCHAFPWIETVCVNSWAKRRMWINEPFKHLAGTLIEGFWNRVETAISASGVPPEKLLFGNCSLLAYFRRAANLGDSSAVKAAWEFCVAKPKLPPHRQAEALMSFLTKDATSYWSYTALKPWEAEWASEQFQKIVDVARPLYGADVVAEPVYAQMAFTLVAYIHLSESPGSVGLSAANLERLVSAWMIGDPTAAVNAAISMPQVNHNLHLPLCYALRDLITKDVFSSFCKQAKLVHTICREFCRKSSPLHQIVENCPRLIESLLLHPEFKPRMHTENKAFPHLLLLLPALLHSSGLVDPIVSRMRVEQGLVTRKVQEK